MQATINPSSANMVSSNTNVVSSNTNLLAANTNQGTGVVSGQVMNPCCCDCSLSSAVSSIIGIEFVWNLIGCLTCLSLYIQASTGSQNVRNTKMLKKSILQEDYEWSQYYDAHSNAVLVTLILFSVGLIVTSLLCLAMSKRVVAFCYGWILCAVALVVVHFVMVATDPYTMTYVSAAFVVPRLYFMLIVFCFGTEIKVYPNGRYVNVVINDDPIIVDAPYQVAYSRPVATYAYPPVVGYGYPGYGYGGYGYHSGDAAVAGLAVGLALGGGYGCYDDCYYDGCLY